MTRIVLVLLVAMTAMALGAAPRSIAGDAVSKPPKSDSSCACTARHQSMVKLRVLLKTMKTEQSTVRTDQSQGQHKILVK